jgi:RES domain-containing protein
LRFAGRCYRAHDPAWSFTPLSGAGAARTGGRFNRKGQPALYLSLDVMTSFGECTQGFTKRLQPLTMCEYDVDCDAIADLRDDATRSGHGVALAELACPWLALQLAGKPVPSHRVAERLRVSGHRGILVPSFVPGATDTNMNLVLWQWGPDLPHKVDVYDPSGRLPKNRLSWPVVSRRGPGEPIFEPVD